MPTSHIKGRVVRIAVRRPEDNKILLIETERQSGFAWELPGGKVDLNETVRQAALRELREETGLVTELTFVRYGKRAIPHDPNIFWEHFMFTGLYTSDRIVLESPLTEYCWSNVIEALHVCPDWWTKHYLSSILP